VRSRPGRAALRRAATRQHRLLRPVPHDVGRYGLQPARYVSHRERHLATAQRTQYRGALLDYDVTDPTTGQTKHFRVAYIWSSEEASSVAEARERALAKAQTDSAESTVDSAATSKSANMSTHE
jgi:hypothetical protein